MSISTANWAPSVSHHLRATKKILQDTIFHAKYVWGCAICCVWELTFVVVALRTFSMKLRLDQPTELPRGWLLTCIVF